MQVEQLTGIVAVSAGQDYSVAVKNDGTVWACGNNEWGQLGNGTITNSDVPVQVSLLSGMMSIASSWNHSLAIKNDGTVWTWGWGLFGELGNGTNALFGPLPVQVSSQTGITAIAAGYFHSLAVKNDGTVWSWGRNSSGQLGIGNFSDSNIPIQVVTLTGITAVAGGIGHSLALKNDGTVWAWGENTIGELGTGSNAMSNFPLQVSTLSEIVAIAAGEHHSLAVRNDGTVWTWGGGHDGELGNGSNTYSLVPVQVMALCAVVTDVEELADDLSIVVFPNPTTGKFTLRTTSSTDLLLEIRDVMGQRVPPSTWKYAGSEIDLSSQPRGMYLLTIRTASQVILRKLVKQ